MTDVTRSLRLSILLCIFLHIIIVYVFAIPPPYDPLSARSCGINDTCNEYIEAPHREKRQATGSIRYLYVTQCGIMETKPADTLAVEVKATSEASVAAHQKAARLVFLMLRFMPKTFFDNVAKRGGLGVFAPDQVVGDFPEFSRHKDTPACKDKCDGNCALTCTSTGRKFDSLVGYSKSFAVVREDNVLCLPSDPYNGKLNVLMHEFAHAVHFTALGRSVLHSKLEDAFAARFDTWSQGYATSDLREFFAEATTSYFRTNAQGRDISAEMNFCGDPKDKTICPDEMSSRQNLKKKDPTLFNLVDEIYSGARTFLQGRIGVCDW